METDASVMKSATMSKGQPKEKAEFMQSCERACPSHSLDVLIVFPLSGMMSLVSSRIACRRSSRQTGTIYCKKSAFCSAPIIYERMESP